LTNEKGEGGGRGGLSEKKRINVRGILEGKRPCLFERKPVMQGGNIREGRNWFREGVEEITDETSSA